MNNPAPQVAQTVWAGDPRQLGTAHAVYVLTWLNANGVQGHTVCADQPVTVTGGEIRYTRLLQDPEHGRPYVDATGEAPAVEAATAPLLVPYGGDVTSDPASLPTPAEGSPAP